MARLSTNRIGWLYTSDDGNTYRVSAVKAYTDQAKQGGSAATGTEKPWPATRKMRRITVKSAAHGSRVIPVYDLTAAILAPTTTINLNADTDSFAFTSFGNPIPEGHEIHKQTEQTT